MGLKIKPENDDLSRNIRRYQVRLRVTATGVMLFAFWNIVKSALITMLRSGNQNAADAQAGDIFEGMSETEAVAVLFGILLVVFAILVLDTVMRLKIYRMAKKESADPDGKRHNSYLIMAGFLVLASAYSIYSIAMSTSKGDYSVTDGIITIIVEFSAMVTLIEVIRSAVMLRKLRDEKKSEEADPDIDSAAELPSGKEAADE